MDDWQFVPLLEKTSKGQLAVGDLWAPHDEHRLLIPKIVIIASMFAFNGDNRMQCCISFLVVEIISLCFLSLLIRLNGERSAFGSTWLFANIALFSPIQFQNWLWPMQFAYFLPYTFLTLCICALYLRVGAGWKFGLAAVCALAGNYSFVHGNLISKLGQDAGTRDPNRRVWKNMDRLEDGGWHVSGYAVCRDDRPADLILFCTRSADGEWVVRTTAIPFSTSAQYIRNSARYDFEFLGSRPPQDAQLGAWEADFPPGVFGPENGETVSAWALDFSRGNYYYHLEGDRELPVQSAMIQGESQSKF